MSDRPVADATPAAALASAAPRLAPEPGPSRHALNYRVSTRLIGRTFYITLLCGSEKRSARRLRREGQLRRFLGVAGEIAVVCTAVSIVAWLLVGCFMVAAYLVKSALGIDLMDGHFFLHGLFFD